MRNFAFVVISFFAVQAWSQTSTIPIQQQGSETSGVAAPEGTSTIQTEDEKKPEAKKVEKVTVTGSHIKRIDVETASPIQTVTRQQLEKSGYNSVADVLRDTTANSFGSVREDSGSNTAGNAYVDLRGLGSSSTLVLLNGQRLPSDAVSGSVDLNLIPTAAIERVDVLKDGASATYGSDALGGVVNIITRKDFVGSEISFAQNTPQQPGGKKQEISLVNGVNIGRANMVNVVQYRDNEKVYSRDRSWSNTGLSTTGSPGSWRDVGGTWKADANCPADMITNQQGGTLCQFRYGDYSTELPALQQLSVMSETTIPIGSRVTTRVRLGGTQKKVQWSYAPSPDIFVIPGAVADGMGLPGHTPGSDIQVRYRLTELGTRDSEVNTKAYNVLLGNTVDVGGGWEVDVSTAYNRIHTLDQGVNGYAITNDLVTAITNGQFNPLGTPGARGNIENTRYQPWEKQTSELTSVDIKAAGPIAEMPSGDLGLAVGSSYTFQKYRDEFDERSVAGDVFGNAGSSGGGQRDTRAVFTELTAPLTSDLELQLAGRYDEYSDFGSSTNPKVGLVYRPTKSVLLRGSVGTGFKAPLMQDLYASTSEGYPTFIDHVSCEREKANNVPGTPACSPSQYLTTSSGNTGLKEERSLSYNFGAMYEPTRDFNISSDLFLTKMNNVVGIDMEDVTLAEQMGIDPAQHGVIVVRDAQGYIESIEAPLQNLSKREVFGIDVGSSVRLGKFRLGTDHSHLFWYKQEGFPGTGQKNELGENGVPKWRNVTSLGFVPNERHDVTLSALTIAGQEKEVEGTGMLPNYTTFNLSYSYKMKRFGTLSAGIYNLMGSTPPIDDSNPNIPLNITLYDQIGRQYYTGYKATF